jgi:hypothetical protein
VDANNSCARTIIFGSFSFIAFLSEFFLFTPFRFFLNVLMPFLLFQFGFFIALHPPPPLFFALVVSVFRLM